MNQDDSLPIEKIEMRLESQVVIYNYNWLSRKTEFGDLVEVFSD